MIRFLCGLFLGLVCLFVSHVHSQIVALDYEQRLAEARGDAQEANEMRDSLLSNGRFIRVYDPKTNKNYYTFKPFVTNNDYAAHPKFIAAR